jgi:hypothetical protein
MRVAVVGVFLGCATVGLASPQQVKVALFLKVFKGTQE